MGNTDEVVVPRVFVQFRCVRVEAIEEGGVFDVEFPRVDSNDWSYCRMIVSKLEGVGILFAVK